MRPGMQISRGVCRHGYDIVIIYGGVNSRQGAILQRYTRSVLVLCRRSWASPAPSPQHRTIIPGKTPSAERTAHESESCVRGSTSKRTRFCSLYSGSSATLRASRQGISATQSPRKPSESASPSVPSVYSKAPTSSSDLVINPRPHVSSATFQESCSCHRWDWEKPKNWMRGCTFRPSRADRPVARDKLVGS